VGFHPPRLRSGGIRLRAAKCFHAPESGILKVWTAPNTRFVAQRDDRLDGLVTHLATSGPMLVGQAADWISGGVNVQRGHHRIEALLRAGWLEGAYWQAKGPSGMRVPQPQRLVGLGSGAQRQYGRMPVWRWNNTVVCRGAVLARLLLRLPEQVRKWSPLLSEARSERLGVLEVSGLRAWVFVVRRGTEPQVYENSVVAALARGPAVTDRERLWVIVPDEECADSARRALETAGVLQRALLTTDEALWDHRLPLSEGFRCWTDGAWRPIEIVALAEIEQQWSVRPAPVEHD